MNGKSKQDLYDEIDENDEMTDTEKRETYFNEIHNQEQEEDENGW